MADSAESLEVSLLPADDDSDGPGEAAGGGPRRRPPLVAVLAVALALAVAAAGVLGWMLWHAEARPDRQEEAVALVQRYTEAFDAHDLEGLRETLADRAAFAGGEHLERPIVGPFRGQELDDFYRSLFRSQVRLTTDGPVQVTGTGPYRVVAVQTVRYTVAGVRVTEQATSLFTLLQLPDRAVILEHVWWRPLAAQAPSMLWAR
jgi:hypothetical protein